MRDFYLNSHSFQKKVSKEKIDNLSSIVDRPLHTTEQHIAAYVKWVENIPNYPQSSAATFWAYTPSSGIVVSSAIQDTSVVVRASAYDVFLNITPQTSSTLRIDSHLNMTVELEEPSGYRQIWITVTGLKDERFIRHAVQAQAELVAQCRFESSYIYMYLPKPSGLATRGVLSASR